MRTAHSGIRCPECGHASGREDLTCGLCGLVLRREEPTAPRPPRPERAPELVVVHREGEPLKTTLGILLLGAVLAPVFTFTPILRFMGWFLAALVHETGHCAVAWAAGCPAIPAISLGGHAMAAHGGQQTMLCFTIWFALGVLTWQFRQQRPWLVILGAATLLYPLFAFTGLREFFFLTGGHLGELAFAVVFFWRAAVGGFSRSGAERVTYATVAWFLFGSNVWLSGGLLFSDKVRAWYAASGSFGLTNDYIRLARSVMHVDLGVVAFLMLAVTLTVPLLAWLLARPHRTA